MYRYFIAAVCCLGVLSQAGWAAPFQPIRRLSGTYVPGEPVMFDVRLPSISNLGAYNIDLILESTTGAAGVDFFFDVGATMPALTGYVFPSTENFFDAATVDAPTRHRITLTDFALSGANVADANDDVANVIFRTTPEFDGLLRVYVDSSLLILDTPSIAPTPVQGFDTLRSDIAAAGSIDLTPVPEPSSLLIAATALCILLVANRKVDPQR